MDDHDQRFKEMLEVCLLEFFKLFFAHWADRFDWEKVEFLKQEAFIDPPQGSRRFLDLVAKVHLREPYRVALRSVEHFVILVHIEIESSDSVAAFHPRMFDYFAWLRSKHQLPVLPIGLFLRVGFDGAGWITYEESLWGENLVQFRYPYIGLPALPALEYLEGENLLGVALSALMNVPEGERARLKAEALQRLAKAQVDARRRFLLSECVEAYLELEDPHLAEFQHLLLTPKYREVIMLAKTNHELGREVGRAEEQLHMLKRMLPKRFGPIDDSVWKRVEAMSYKQREQLAEDLIVATSLEQLGLAGESR